ncbi:MAG: motility protein A [Planctomycetales bacterium]|nr:motility protein A [Planctomycetales bacterium]
MDLASVIGLLMGVAFILMAILSAPGGSLSAFIDVAGALVTVGGALAATIICFPLKKTLGIFGVSKNVFFNKSDDVRELIALIVSLAETARREGLLALEAKIDDIDNSFIVLGIQMAVDGTQPEMIEDIMRNEMDAITGRHKDGKALFEQIGKTAPAFGMIGTLLGLILMLGNMDDPDALGPGMAVAMITTLYGAVLANLFAIPFAEKLGFIHKEELLAMEITVRGIMAIQSGDNPRVIEQKLNTFIAPKQRDSASKAA